MVQAAAFVGPKRERNRGYQPPFGDEGAPPEERSEAHRGARPADSPAATDQLSGRLQWLIERIRGIETLGLERINLKTCASAPISDDAKRVQLEIEIEEAQYGFFLHIESRDGPRWFETSNFSVVHYRETPVEVPAHAKLVRRLFHALDRAASRVNLI